MSTAIQRIYASRNEQRIEDFRAGLRQGLKQAAELVDMWDGEKCPYRLGDLILFKFNQTKRKPRKSRASKKGRLK